MKKFLLLTVGFETPTQEMMTQWMCWFDSIKENIVEQVGLANGKEVTKDGSVNDLPTGLDAITGYLVINAINNEEALEIAKNCPMITSTNVYEIRSP